VDIRIARTDRAIEQAFMELREKNPLEKIKIKDLCAMACINKSTFYAHYEDIYALANALENKLIESILASVPRTNDSVALHQAETLTRELFHAFMQNQRAVNILFSGSRQGIFANSIEKGLRQRFEEADPTFAADLNRGILLSFCVQGCFYAFANNSSRMDEGKHLKLDVTTAAKDFIIDSSYDSVYGARPIKRFIQSRVETLIAKAIIQGSYTEGATLTVDYDGTGLVLR